jgi:TetR/AcrR family transcriptional regulator
MFDSLIEFIEDSLINRINLILQDEKDTLNRSAPDFAVGIGVRRTQSWPDAYHDRSCALMFEQDRLQGRINQLLSGLKRNCVRFYWEKKMREGSGFTYDETLLASQLLAYCEGMLSRFVRSEFKYRPTQEFDTRWPLISAQLQ